MRACVHTHRHTFPQGSPIAAIFSLARYFFFYRVNLWWTEKSINLLSAGCNKTAPSLILSRHKQRGWQIKPRAGSCADTGCGLAAILLLTAAGGRFKMGNEKTHDVNESLRSFEVDDEAPRGIEWGGLTHFGNALCKYKFLVASNCCVVSHLVRH